MVNRKVGFSVVEIAMVVVVFAIISVVALPQSTLQLQNDNHNITLEVSIDKARSAYAIAIANKSSFPTVSEIVAFIDADFAAEMNDRSGIIFRDAGKRVTVNTFNDIACVVSTNVTEPGVSDVVRCIQKSEVL